jgi:MtN3 and saliva related transmembrane protein
MLEIIKEMKQLEWLGFIARFFSMIAFIPQVYKTYKMKSAKNISVQTFVICAIGTIVWSIYGFLLGKTAVYITNIVMLIIFSIQVVQKVMYDK